MLACSDPDVAAELYRLAKLLPSSSTRLFMSKQLHIRLNGRFLEHYGNIFKGFRDDGALVIVKILSSSREHLDKSTFPELRALSKLSAPPPCDYLVQQRYETVTVGAHDGTDPHFHPGVCHALLMEVSQFVYSFPVSYADLISGV
jgi:hypothetical protein